MMGWSARIGGVGLVLALPVAVACNALTGASDLSADGDGVLAPRRPDEVDATSPRNDGSTVLVGDSGSDAPLDATPLGFCASLSPSPTLCTDFDDGVFPGPWTVGLAGNATTTATNAASRSPTRSLLLDVPGGADGAAFVSKGFATAPKTKVTVSFSVLLESRDVARDLELGTIQLGLSGGNRYEAQLELIGGNELNIEEETPTADGNVPQRDVPLGVTLTPGVWKRITWSIGFGVGTSTMAVVLEGVTNPTPFAAEAHRYLAAPIVRIGDEFPSPYQSKLRFDDVVVDIQ